MKQCILSLIALSFIGSVYAQIQYESPHVKDGKTIQFDLPAGFYEVADVNIDEVEMFTRQENLNFKDLNRVANTTPVMAILHLSKEENSYESILKQLKDNFQKNKDGITIIEEPVLRVVNGRDMIFTGAKGDIDGEKQAGAYLCGIAFGDYMILITYSAEEGIEDEMEYDAFKEIVGSLKEVTTEKEDRFATSDWGVELPVRSNDQDEYYLEDGSGNYSFDAPPVPPAPSVVREEVFEMPEIVYYSNNLFKTKISHGDISRANGDNWKLPLRPNALLLSEFVYKQTDGSVKVFSGGSITNYSSKKEIAEAIQKMMNFPLSPGLKKKAQFVNKNHRFKRYALSEGGTLTTVYTTEVNNELVFFVVDEGSNPDPNFKSVVEEFMLTTSVNSSREELEE